jgi:hypothetical protein
MKKVSTASAKATKNFSQQKLTIGLDLGDRTSWYCLLDEVGDVVLEQKVGTTPKAMREVFAAMPRSRIAPAPLPVSAFQENGSIIRLCARAGSQC